MAVHDHLRQARLWRKLLGGLTISPGLAGGASPLPPHCDCASDQALALSFT
jgi:hypothetical protein